MVTKNLQIILTLSVLFVFAQHTSAETLSCGALKSGSLKIGMKSTGVRTLQVLLNKNPATQVTKSGAGSPGFETNYFGLKLASAVKRYQELHAKELLVPIHLKKGTGVVGVKTRLSLLSSCNKIAAADDVTVPTSVSVSGNNTTLSPSAIAALISALTSSTTPSHVISGGGGGGGGSGGGGGGGGSTPPPAPVAPTISFSASSTSINHNATTTLSWSASPATSCDGSWMTSTTTSVGVSGSFVTPKLATSTTYSLSCVNGSATASSSLTVGVIVRTASMNEFLAENSLTPSPGYTAVPKYSYSMNSAVDIYSDNPAMPFRLGQPNYGTALTAVPTFESIGLYWGPPTGSSSTLASVRYRIKGDQTWKNALPLWFDPRNHEYRGSIVLLSKNTTYQIETWLSDDTVDSVEVKTRDDVFPVVSTTTLASNATSSYVISTSGTANGYVLYTAASGTTTIDMGFAHQVASSGSYGGSCITVNASYVIIRGLMLKNCQREGVYINPRMHDIVIEENDISGWGGTNVETATNTPIEGPTAFNKVGYDYDAGVFCSPNTDQTILPSEKTVRLTVQRNKFHDPRYGASSWFYGHPAGPQAVSLFNCGGNHVIRYNELYSSPGHFMNDGIGGLTNFSFEGSSGPDTDIYGNNIRGVYDDAIESDGGNQNVRIWGNYLATGASGVSLAANTIGPVYLFRNIRGENMSAGNQWDPASTTAIFFKFGSNTSNPNNLTNGGRAYVFHNTQLQPAAPTLGGFTTTMGGSSMIDKAGGDTCNIVSRNNIAVESVAGHSIIRLNEVCGKNDLDYDLYYGNLATSSNPVETHGRSGLPTYHGNVDPALVFDSSYDPYGPTSTVKVMGPLITPTVNVPALGDFSLSPASLGYGMGQVLPNFNDAYASPDVGAHQSGTPKMEFGVNAYQ